MHTYTLSLGSNIQPRLGYLRRALKSLGERGEVLACSSIYETSPVGMETGDIFLNCALSYQSRLIPPDLLCFVKQIEQDSGRDLNEYMVPRTLDIDIISWSGGAWHDDRLILPHPRAAQRLFVIIPCNELCAGAYAVIEDARQGIALYGNSALLFAEHAKESA